MKASFFPLGCSPVPEATKKMPTGTIFANSFPHNIMELRSSLTPNPKFLKLKIQKSPFLNLPTSATPRPNTIRCIHPVLRQAPWTGYEKREVLHGKEVY
jgi:hypothetical protein